MNFVEWGQNPFGQNVPLHIGFFLMWVAAIGGLLFLIVHAIYVRYFAKADVFEATPSAQAARVPERVARHSLAARLFHWIMAAAMIGLLVTAFLPKVGIEFPWVTWHWIFGIVLTASIIFHIVHASFWLDFWSIWPDKTDLDDASKRMKRALGQAAPPPRKFAKYPLENKAYHGVIVLTGLAVILTGVFMMFRVRTPFFTRNPYMFSDMSWGLMYVLHGLAGIGLIGLVMVHVYFALRPEKLYITKSMIFGDISREHFLEDHDPERWPPEPTGKPKRAAASNAR